jgi:hypothetical protein
MLATALIASVADPDDADGGVEAGVGAKRSHAALDDEASNSFMTSCACSPLLPHYRQRQGDG